MKRIVILVSVVALGVGSVLGFGLASGSSPPQTQKTYGPGWVNWAHVGPTQPIAQALSGIEGDVGAVYYLNPETGAWLRYVPGKPEVSNLTTMEFGQSYLMLLTAPTAMTIPTEATFLATPTPCPACPSPEPTDSALAEYFVSEMCTSIKIRIETNEVQLEIAEAGLLVGRTPSEVRADIAQLQQVFDKICQGVPLREFTIIGSACAEAGRWVGIEDTTMLYAPSAQSQVWGNRFESIVHKYCSTQ